MKNIAQRMLLLLVAATCCLGNPAQAWEYPTEQIQRFPYEEGAGTEEHPYVIKTAQQLADLAWYVNNYVASDDGTESGPGSCFLGQYFVLGADIDLNPGYTFNEDGTFSGGDAPEEWIPIGDFGTSFQGFFDGNGHTISGLYSTLGQGCSGLFGMIELGKVKNVTLLNSLLVSAHPAVIAEDLGSYCIGSIVGWARDAVVEGCTSSASICLKDGEADWGYAGGIVGEASSDYLASCKFSGTISVGVGHLVTLGGIVGKAFVSESISDCENAGSIQAAQANQVAGIVGELQNGAMYGLKNSGSLSTTLASMTAGIVATALTYTEMKDCANSGTIYVENGYAVGLTGGCYNLEQMVACSNTGKVTSVEGTAAGLGIVHTKRIDGCFNLGEVSGKLEAAGLFYGCCVNELHGCYNEGNVTSSEGNAAGLVSWFSANGGNKTEDVAAVSDCYNKGNIKSDTKAAAGLFAACECHAVITASSNEGTVEGIDDVGGLVAYPVSSSPGYRIALTDCRNEGTVTGADWVGGLIAAASDNITGCSNAGAVTGKKQVGGIAGNIGSDTISCCWNEAPVTGTSMVGGLAGKATFTVVENAYNVADIAGTESVGGLLGLFACKNGTEYFRPKYVYNVGGVTASSCLAGSIVGEIDFPVSYESELTGCVACYYLNGDLPALGGFAYRHYSGAETMVKEVASDMVAKSLEEFADGTVCILLNEGQEPTPWGQVPGTDPTPLLNGAGNPSVSSIQETAAGKSFRLLCDGRALTVLGEFDEAVIHTISGRRVASFVESTFNVASLAKGIYCITLTKGTEVFTQKFIVR